MRFNRELRCSRTKNVRCATRSLVLPHLLGPESRTFEPLIGRCRFKSTALMTMQLLGSVFDGEYEVQPKARSICLQGKSFSSAQCPISAPHSVRMLSDGDIDGGALTY